ncbi:sigma-70 family RNA polymerase sigma factor [Catenulispora sp. NL8]|uniref:Sigma-70 family RNA polymerase sigma factor n=1 Tax=Catenulispora pinistramenti TaxID=2705254 RepID=A0ABS5KHJ8_9ACTN|nr:sigma-70 family RNA polymerase sigma factor [Catenulispora pinistramenti]MBS2545527.1 sigma-70 family RNA polymerase sigma factor [Catenulispora pinistramenti]
MKIDIAASASSALSTSPLHAVESAFLTLCADDAPLAFPASFLLTAAPAGRDEVTVTELRKTLLSKSTPMAARDTVWAELVRRSREMAGAWTVVAVAMAMPALKTIAASFARSFDGPVEDLDGEVVTAFLDHLATIDISRPGILPRLRWAAFRAAERTVASEIDFVRHASAFQSEPPRMPFGHEDLVLVRAEREGVLSAADADLIGMTRLEGVGLAEAAEMLGVTPNAVKIRRQRAEARLVAWLQGRPVPSKSALVQSRGRA